MGLSGNGKQTSFVLGLRPSYTSLQYILHRNHYTQLADDILTGDSHSSIDNSQDLLHEKTIFYITVVSKSSENIVVCFVRSSINHVTKMSFQLTCKTLVTITKSNDKRPRYAARRRWAVKPNYL